MSGFQRPDSLQSIYVACSQVFGLGRGSVHGPSHWTRVEKNAIGLCKKTAHSHLTACRLFAICHDCQRENEFYDPQHGHRAAKFLIENFPQCKEMIEKEVFEKLIYALKYHNDGMISEDPTIGVCWDADRLDLCRPGVGIKPSVKYMSTNYGKEWVAKQFGS